MRKRSIIKKLPVIFAAVLVIIVVAVSAFALRGVVPESKREDAYSYFGVEKDSDKLAVVLDGAVSEVKGIKIDGRVYLPENFVEENINIRFYYDTEHNGVMYSSFDKMYIMYPDTNQYEDMEGKTYSTDYPVLRVENECLYIDFEYVKSITNISCTYKTDPERLLIETLGTEKQRVKAQKKTSVRTGPGIKYKIFTVADTGDILNYIGDESENWARVTTADGFAGYVEKECIGEIYTEIPEDTFVEKYDRNLRDYKINMAWFQVTRESVNDNVDKYLENTSGINVLSPTWYAVYNQNGDINSLASKQLVDKMHERGIEVWPLINDFEKNVDFEKFYKSYESRKKLIDNLMSEAGRYSYDGYNIDFENIKKEYSRDYLQFLRELSLACRQNGLTLSVDNYPPQNYNRHYHLEEQAVFVDYIVIMNYDEHWSGSEAGSVASLPFVKNSIIRTCELVKSGQIIGAIPFYSRLWVVEGEITKSSKSLSMKESIDTLTENGVTPEWSEETGQYYGSYESDEGTVKIWAEDDRSIKEKMSLYKEYKLGGVAEWKLGFQTDTVWRIIEDALKY